MSSNKPAASQEDLVEAMARARGVAAREWTRIVVKYDPGMLQRHTENVLAVMNLPELPKSTKELIIVAIDAANCWPGISVHIRSALKAGATEAQVAEAILTAGIPCGPHAVVYGMEKLQETLDEMASE
jgi:AhpD family alkylhydroperoxidase